MSEPNPRTMPHESLIAALRRDDLPSFLVSLPDMTVVSATRPCGAFTIEAGATAPLGVRIVAKRVGQSLRSAPRLERVRLPFSFVPKAFACIAVNAPAGRMVVFADPLALATGRAGVKALPAARNRLPAVIGPRAVRAGPQRALRFAWETDETGRLVGLSPQVVAALGGTADQWIGRTFAEAAQAGLLRDAAPIQAALQRGGSFFGLALLTGETVPRRLEFGGVPLFDAARRRRGTRGFGILWSPEAPAVAPPQPPRRLGTGEAAAEPAGVNVVPLRGGPLTAREQSAFQEIARTLSEAIEDWPARPGNGAAAEPGADAASSLVPETAPLDAPMDAGDDEPLLDRLPIGLVVQQGGAVVRANRTLLGWLGMEDTETFIATGGLAARLVRDEGSGRLDLETLAGDRLPVEVRLVSSPWRGKPALVHVVRSLETVAPASPPAAAGAVATTADARRERAAARREALDLIPFPLLLIDDGGVIENANRAAMDATGFSDEELQGEPFTIVIGAESQVAAVRMLDRAVASDEPDAPETRLLLRHRTGAMQQMDAALSRSGLGRRRFCLALRSIPSAMQSAASAPPPRTDEPVPPGRFDGLARRISHDLRDPLNVILSFVDSVRQATFGPVGNSRYAKHADAAAEAGRALLDTLVDLDGLAVPPATRRPHVALVPVVERSLSDLADMARRRRVLVRSYFPRPVIARCDDAVVGRMARLLLDEALRATPADGQVIVSLTETEEGAVPLAILQVRDGGPALSEDEIAQALDPLSPAPTADRFTTAGRPLRMAHVATLARAQSGLLTLRRGLDAGMLAELRLPR